MQFCMHDVESKSISHIGIFFSFHVTGPSFSNLVWSIRTDLPTWLLPLDTLVVWFPLICMRVGVWAHMHHPLYSTVGTVLAVRGCMALLFLWHSFPLRRFQKGATAYRQRSPKGKAESLVRNSGLTGRTVSLLIESSCYYKSEMHAQQCANNSDYTPKLDLPSLKDGPGWWIMDRSCMIGMHACCDVDLQSELEMIDQVLRSVDWSIIDAFCRLPMKWYTYGIRHNKNVKSLLA